ncbi:MAG: ABC transporter permease, partial [Intestinibacter bartlettii]
FWEDPLVEIRLFSLTIVWVFGVFLISAIILGGILFKTSYGSILFCGVIVGGLLILNIIPKVQDYNPIQLININMDILKGDVEIFEILKSLWTTLGASVLFVISSIVVFCKKEI